MEQSTGKAPRLLPVILKLHRHLVDEHWDGRGLIGPDPGIRFNWRVGRFIKSYLRNVPWHDSYYYLQAQGYWVLANWRLYLETGEAIYREIALHCSEHMLERQREDGAWEYPNPEWAGRIATAECTWGALGLIETYRHTSDDRFLCAVLRWHHFLLNETGFERVGDELSVNYFASRASSRVPNNSAFVLRFLTELAVVTGDESYSQPCAGLAAFMRRAQKPSGEFPYMVRGPGTGRRLWEHFQCYQYNAFQCLDLMRHYELSRDPALPPMLAACLSFLSSGLAESGRAYYDCFNRTREFTYHAAALGAAFSMAGPLGFPGYETLAERAFSYLSRLQRPDGGFPCSCRDHRVLRDVRSYPRPLAMILFHCLVKIQVRAATAATVAY